MLTFVPLLLVCRDLLHVLCSQLGHYTLCGEAGPFTIGLLPIAGAWR